MEHHDIDVMPIPKDKKPQYINEPWLIDSSLMSVDPECSKEKLKEPDGEKDNIRFYFMYRWILTVRQFYADCAG